MTRTCAVAALGLTVGCGLRSESLSGCPEGTQLSAESGACAAVDEPMSALASDAPRSPPKRCPDGALWSGESGTCAPINRTTSALASDASSLPDVAEMRRKKLGPGKIPVPGGIGSGTTFNTGRLQATAGAALYTRMFIYLNGIAVGTGSAYNGYTFTASTNRTEKTLEIVGIYYGAGPGSGSLGIYDWSCSSSDPCATPSGTKTEPSWVWSQGLTSLSTCYYRLQTDGWHDHDMVYYVNDTTLTNGSLNPPLWTNTAYLWNYCTLAWEVPYSHQFRANQKDCSIDDSSCGWWGPILETFLPDPQPSFKELGFKDTWLLHDKGWSALDATDTSWSPPVPNLHLFHIEPNRSWGVGNVTYN